MTENFPHEELDFDEWLATGSRTVKYVYLYARMDLIAEIDKLEAQRVDTPDAPGAESSLAGGENPNEAIDAAIKELLQKVDASKRSFRVTGLNDQEVEEIRSEIRAAQGDKLDQLAKLGRDEALATARRMGVTVPNEINLAVRAGAKKRTDDFLSREVGLAMASKAVQAQGKNGLWVNLEVDQIRSMYEVLGDAQMDRLVRACQQANAESPEVTPGK